MTAYYAMVVGIWTYAGFSVYLMYLASTRTRDRDPPDDDS